MTSAHVFAHTVPNDGRAPEPVSRCPAKLPLQGSNLDSSDPESRGLSERIATLPSGIATRRERPHTVSHTVPHTRPTCKCGETDPSKFGQRTKRGKRTWQAQCKACQVAYHREWRANPEGRAKMRAGVSASRQRYPERNTARSRLRYAVRHGHIEVGPCHVAGADCRGGIEGHHPDYSKPLDVIWVCRAHHRALDRARRGAA